MFGLANEPLSCMGMIRILCLLAVYKKHQKAHIQTWFADFSVVEDVEVAVLSGQEHYSFTLFALGCRILIQPLSRVIDPNVLVFSG
jgi:hypothetical protein